MLQAIESDEEKPHPLAERCKIVSACVNCDTSTRWHVMTANGEIHVCSVDCARDLDDILPKERIDAVSRGTDRDRTPPDGS